MSDEDEWINTEIHAGDATGPATATVLEAVAQILREGPEGKRYDIDLNVEETDHDTGGDST